MPLPMHFQGDGKRRGRRSVGAMSVGHTGRLLFIQDTISERRFLCDTGAQMSILPASPVDMLGGEYGPPLTAANGTPIRTYGARNVELCFGGQLFNWKFITAKVTFPILGADFLCAYGLLVDVKGSRLVNAETFCSYACTLSGPSDCLICFRQRMSFSASFLSSQTSHSPLFFHPPSNTGMNTTSLPPAHLSMPKPGASIQPN